MPEPHFQLRPWGYDRRQVDAFVARTAERLDAALAARTPDGAVKQALDRLGEETSSVLQRAHQIAEEVTYKSRADAEDRRLRAEQEAAAIHQAAEARVAAFDAELEMLWQERQRLVNDIDRISEQLRALVTEADERFPEEPDPEEAAAEPVGTVAGEGVEAGEEVEVEQAAEAEPEVAADGEAPGAVAARPARPDDATQEMSRVDPTQEMDPSGSRAAG